MSASKSTAKGIDARRTPRRTFQRPVGFLMSGGYDIVQGVQVSEGGILVTAPKNKFPGIKVAQQLVATFIIPGGVVIVAKGEIVYVKPYVKDTVQLGIRFETLPLHERRLIRIYVSAKTQQESQAEAEDFDTAVIKPAA
jgi:hypothetical protein